MARKNGIPTRIDEELDKILKEIAERNEISIKQASRELARISKVKIKGSKTIKEIRF